MAKAEKRGAYDIAVATEGELDRLKRWTYPHTVSVAVLKSLVSENKIPKDFSLLDIGAGPNTALADWMREGGNNSYVALDRDERAITAQMSVGNLALQGLVHRGLQSPLGEKIPDQFFDVTHSRFLLMNLSPEERRLAIEESLRVTRKAAVFMDWNWETLGGTPAVDRLRKLGMKLLPLAGSNARMGAPESQRDLRREIQKHGFRAESSSHLQPKGNFYGECQDVCKNIMIPTIEQLEKSAQTSENKRLWSGMLEEANDILKQLTEESTKEKPQNFRSAAIGITVATRR